MPVVEHLDEVLAPEGWVQAWTVGAAFALRRGWDGRPRQVFP
jgi:hypothetical protein